jgi:hypothetical protein
MEPSNKDENEWCYLYSTITVFVKVALFSGADFSVHPNYALCHPRGNAFFISLESLPVLPVRFIPFELPFGRP